MACVGGVGALSSRRRSNIACVAGVGEGNVDISIDPNAKPIEDFGSGITADPKKVAVLFDFDGTIGDTETPAMEVAYWELAPYFPEAAGVCNECDMVCYLYACSM